MRQQPKLKSGGGVILVSALQLVVGLVLLGVYEGYKARQRRIRGAGALARGKDLQCFLPPAAAPC